MKKVLKVNEIRLIAGLALTGILCVAYVLKAPGNDIILNGADDQEVAPLVLQADLGANLIGSTKVAL